VDWGPEFTNALAIALPHLKDFLASPLALGGLGDGVYRQLGMRPLGFLPARSVKALNLNEEKALPLWRNAPTVFITLLGSLGARTLKKNADLSRVGRTTLKAVVHAAEKGSGISRRRIIRHGRINEPCYLPKFTND